MQACHWAIADLPGLSQEQIEQLKACGIETTKQLLSRSNTTRSQSDLAAQLHLHPQYLKKWAALADLARLPSVGCQYCGVLLHSGIASVSQLAQTPVHRLHRQVLRLEVATLQRNDLCPPVDVTRRWVEEARVAMRVPF
ncbi:DUF4332 domain-containing protein [Oscillatoria sp. FACHB-1406]|nr:DUF4332 domain-containing protein [Oscillatoria sp. FACHB-1406]